jgi:hypothetical protein
MIETFAFVTVMVVAGLAHDIARRSINSRAPVVQPNIQRFEEMLQQVAVDAACALNTANATAEVVTQTDKVMKNLAEDWLAKFKQVEAAQKKLDQDVPNKVAATLATAMPARGYNR